MARQSTSESRGTGSAGGVVVPARATPHEATLMVEDLTQGLVWPLLLRAPALALRPSRVMFGIATLVVAGLIGSIGELWATETKPAFASALSDDLGGSFAMLAGGIGTGDFGDILRGLGSLVAMPGELASAYPVSIWALGIPMFAVWALGSGAIARSAACEAGGRPVPSWTQIAGFAVSRWPAFVVAWAVPAVIVTLIWLVLALTGWLALSVPVLDVVGAGLYGLAALFGLIAVVTQAVLILGGPMLVPSIATEGTDAIDGMQRSFGYVFGRPLRLVIYLLIAALCAVIALGLVRGAVGWADAFASEAVQTWASESNAGKMAASAEHTGTAAVASRVFSFWRTVFEVILGGFTISYAATAGTLVYLCARRINDGQDVAEVWDT